MLAIDSQGRACAPKREDGSVNAERMCGSRAPIKVVGVDTGRSEAFAWQAGVKPLSKG